jgi:hypothetical protein
MPPLPLPLALAPHARQVCWGLADDGQSTPYFPGAAASTLDMAAARLAAALATAVALLLS